jgi:anti-sigma B factor antagonist
MESTITVIAPIGILDSTQSEVFRQQVDNALVAESEAILIDLQDITFIDSSGLGMLVVVLKKIRAAKKQMYVCSINDQVRMLFELTSMDRVFEVLPDRAAFEERLTNAASA